MKKQIIVLMFALFLEFAYAVCSFGQVSSTISGMPLRVVCDYNGVLRVYRLHEYQGQTNYYKQYFDVFHTFLFADTNRWSASYNSPYLTVESNTNIDPWNVECVFNAGASGLRVRQTLSYVDGAAYFSKTWLVENIGSMTYTNLRLIHGGDTYFANYDYSRGYWDAQQKMIYLANPDSNVSGIMGFNGAPQSPPDAYYEDRYSSVYIAMSIGSLPNTYNTNHVDAGYALQWNRASLGPGQSWTITAYEKWTDSGTIQVIAPAERVATPGQKLTNLFSVVNLQTNTDTIALSVTSSTSWPTNLPAGAQVVLPANASTSITAVVTVPTSAVPGTVSHLTLVARSAANPAIANSDSMQITVTNQPAASGAEAHFRAGIGLIFVWGDLPGADEEFRLALVDDPNHAGALLMHAICGFLRTLRTSPSISDLKSRLNISGEAWAPPAVGGLLRTYIPPESMAASLTLPSKLPPGSPSLGEVENTFVTNLNPEADSALAALDQIPPGWSGTNVVLVENAIPVERRLDEGDVEMTRGAMKLFKSAEAVTRAYDLNTPLAGAAPFSLVGDMLPLLDGSPGFLTVTNPAALAEASNLLTAARTHLTNGAALIKTRVGDQSANLVTITPSNSAVAGLLGDIHFGHREIDNFGNGQPVEIEFLPNGPVEVISLPSLFANPLTRTNAPPFDPTGGGVIPANNPLAPAGAILQPTNGAAFYIPKVINICAAASGGGAGVAKMEFRVDNQSIGADMTYPFNASWLAATAGTYALTAVLWDNQNHVSTSAPVNVSFVTSGAGSLNLLPHTPAGWLAPMVVSSNTGTSVYAVPLLTTHTLYVDCAVRNTGPSAAGPFWLRLYLDGIQKGSQFIGGLSSNAFTTWTDVNIGNLAAGTHQLTLKIDADRAIAESNETDNEYTQPIVVMAPGPNLSMSVIGGWAGSIVVSSITGTTVNASSISYTDEVYVDWMLMSDGTKDVTNEFNIHLILDGDLLYNYSTVGLPVDYYLYVEDQPIGTLSPGGHMLRLVADPYNAEVEGLETDNTYTKTFRVHGPADNLGGAWMSGGAIQVDAAPAWGLTNQLQISANLRDWWAVSNVVNVTNAVQIIDFSPTNAPVRFYRLAIP